MHIESKFKVPDHVIMKVIGDDAVILDLDAGKYYGLNEVGAKIWQLIQADSNLGIIQSTLASEFDVDEQTLKRDAAVLLKSLLEAKLITEE